MGSVSSKENFEFDQGNGLVHFFEIQNIIHRTRRETCFIKGDDEISIGREIFHTPLIGSHSSLRKENHNRSKSDTQHKRKK
jgi:hypothetical protein